MTPLRVNAMEGYTENHDNSYDGRSRNDDPNSNQGFQNNIKQNDPDGMSDSPTGQTDGKDTTQKQTKTKSIGMNNNIPDNHTPYESPRSGIPESRAGGGRSNLTAEMNGHDIRAIAPNIDNMTYVIGVHPELVRQWVFAGLSNDTTTQDKTLHQIVQIIYDRTGSLMTGQALADLKKDLANRSLEAQGRPILSGDEEPLSTKLAGDDPRRLLENRSASAISVASEINDPLRADEDTCRDMPPKPTSTIGLLDLLQESRLAHLAPEFLISDIAKQKTEVQQKYEEALNEIRVLSAESADFMSQEEVPKTEEERLAFQAKWKGLIQNSHSGGAARGEELILRMNRLYGLKAALNVLDSAVAHRKRFLGALQNSTDPRKNSFYHEQIDNINKTIQNLQSAAASILHMIEILNTTRFSYLRELREPFDSADRDRLVRHCHDAIHHALYSNRYNIQYAEAIRAGDPQAARDLAQKAQSHTREAEFLYSGIDAAIHRPDREVATYGTLSLRRYSEAAAFFEAANEVGAGNQRNADLYAQAATYYRHAREAKLVHNKALTEQWYGLAETSFLAVNPSLPIHSKLYTQAVTYYRNAIEATLAGNKALAEQWHQAGCYSWDAGRLTTLGRFADAARYGDRAAAIARSINRSWSEWANQTFLPGSK